MGSGTRLSYLIEQNDSCVMWHPRVVRRLSTGKYFGVTSCIFRSPHQTSVMAVGHCELYSLSRKDLTECVGIWPDLAEQLTSSGEFKLRQLPLRRCHSIP